MNEQESSGNIDTRRVTVATVLMLVAFAILAGFLVASVSVGSAGEVAPAGEVGSGLRLPLGGGR